MTETKESNSSFIAPRPLPYWKECVATARQHLEQSREHDNDTTEEWVESFVSQNYNEAIKSLAYHLSQNETRSKEQILSVRTILRFLLVTLGVPESYRERVQTKFCQPNLLDLLGRVVVIFKEDSKSRIQACRILTNLVTNNITTSRKVLNHWDWQPSEWKDRIFDKSETSIGGDEPCTYYWLDLLLATTTMDRSALAALVVCWYNALQMASQEVMPDILQSSLIISNLLRHLLPSSAVLSPKRTQVDGSPKDDSNNGDEDEDDDPATEWITLLVCLFCRKSSLSTIYNAATGHEVPNDSTTRQNQSCSYVLPEHMILLQVLLAQLDQSKPDDAVSLLGETPSILQDNVHFLVCDLYPSIRQTLQSNGTTHTPLVETTQSLGPTALSIVREILAEVLVHDLPQIKDLRELIGQVKKTVPMFVRDLAFYFDQVQDRFKDLPAKDVVLTDEEQRIFVSLVRLLGNVCHGCRACQDHLRETLVPVDGDGHSGDSSNRSGLHLLLSCTSLSHTCFTLREWSVVAIRNALDNNNENQAVVAQLQAQQPAPSAPLQEMGVQMELEKNGKVSLKPIREEDRDL